MNSSVGRRHGWLLAVGLAMVLFAFHFAIAPFPPQPHSTPWTLVAPLALLCVGAGWRLFPGSVSRVRIPRVGFVSNLDWASVVLQPAQRCPYCHEGLSKRDDLTRCGDCSTVYHLACAREGESCGTLGCRSARSFAGAAPGPHR